MNDPAQVKVVVGWALLVVIGLASMTWIQPKLLGQEREECDALKQRLARAEDGAAEIRALVEELARIRKSTASLKRVPRESQFAVLIQDLNEKLSSLGIEQREITNGGSIDLGPAKTIPMRILIQSDFLGAFETIEWIESLPRLIRVQRVVMEAKDKSNPWESEIKAEITLDAVFDPSAPEDQSVIVDREASRS